MQTDKLYWGRFDATADEYAPILAYAQAHRQIRYAEFDADTVSEVNLFALRENFDFEAFDETLDRIIKTLPAIKRIFSHPITRLKDSSVILPVESVRVVNNTTIVHASVHSELWDNITEDGLRPKKLLTINHEDDYSIYENLAFARAIDIILQLVARNMRLMKDMLYASRDLKFNLLEREDHLAYYLALGKLHIGYIHDYDQYLEAAQKSLDKLVFVDRVIRARLGSPIYKHCKRRLGKFELKKTNIFRHHKDYRRIYQLLKFFSDARIGEFDSDADRLDASNEGYTAYCTLLALFAAGHFNFSFGDRPIDLFGLNAVCTCKDWRLKIESLPFEEGRALRFTFVKDAVYTILLLPTVNVAHGSGEDALRRLGALYDADEYLIADPYEEAGGAYISLFDLESFRRIQQILLRGMIFADRAREICPFCSRTLSRAEGDTVIYECAACRTQIAHLTCPEKGMPYYATRIKNAKPPAPELRESARRDRRLYSRMIEAGMHFRNITAIGDVGEIVCPNCGKIHPFA